jgi:hypothetical protein
MTVQQFRNRPGFPARGEAPKEQSNLRIYPLYASVMGIYFIS